MIKQGENLPIILRFAKIPYMEYFEASLRYNTEEKKHWSKEDISIDSDKIILPLSQNDTLSLPPGGYVLEMKFLDGNGAARTLCTKNLHVSKRNDHTIMGDGDSTVTDAFAYEIEYDAETGQIVYKGFSPYIAENGNWYAYNDETGEYFDTNVKAHGEAGKDGINGKDGKDGYTPRKGIDYFDGRDGRDGRDGVDGKDGINGRDGSDATVTEESINAALGTDVKEEISKLDSVVNSKVDTDEFNSSEIKQLAISNAEQIVIEKKKDDKYSLYDAFIEDNRLKDPMYAVDLASIVEPNSTKYYTSFATAISDVNDGNTSHATSTSSGAVCKVCKNSDGIVLIQMLKSASTAQTGALIIDSPCFIDLNGYTLTFENGGYIRLNAYVCFYGMKEGSVIHIAQSAYCMYFYNTRLDVIVLKIITESGHAFSSRDESYINLTNVSSTVDLDNQVSFLEVFGNSCATLTRCKFDMISVVTDSDFPEGFLTVNSSTDGIFEIVDCDINFISKTDLGDDTACCISGGTPYSTLVIKNSNLYGTNNAVQMTSKNVFIINSTLCGCVHGGLYGVHGQNIFAKNCTFHKEYDVNMLSQNNYASYFGYNSNSKLDNVKFTSYNNRYGIPAIKTGASKYHNTQVHFSNCEMEGIRVDANCRAYMGKGIKDSIRNASVNGEIIKTEYAYNFELVEVLGLEGEIRSIKNAIETSLIVDSNGNATIKALGRELNVDSNGNATF